MESSLCKCAFKLLLVIALAFNISCSDDSFNQTVENRPEVKDGEVFYISNNTLTSKQMETDFSQVEIENLLADGCWSIPVHPEFNLAYDNDYVAYGDMVRLADGHDTGFVPPYMVYFSKEGDEAYKNVDGFIFSHWDAFVAGRVITIKQRYSASSVFGAFTVVGYDGKRLYVDTALPADWSLPSKMNRAKSLRRLYFDHVAD